MGTHDDWVHLIEKLQTIKSLLIHDRVDRVLSYYLNGMNQILVKLLETYEGNPDRIWWSHLTNTKVEYGSLPVTYYTGWITELCLFSDHHVDLCDSDFPSTFSKVPIDIIDVETQTTKKTQLIVGHAVASVGYEGQIMPQITWGLTK